MEGVPRWRPLLLLCPGPLLLAELPSLELPSLVPHRLCQATWILQCLAVPSCQDPPVHQCPPLLLWAMLSPAKVPMLLRLWSLRRLDRTQLWGWWQASRRVGMAWYFAVIAQKPRSMVLD
jgi:hypothetical protein